MNSAVDLPMPIRRTIDQKSVSDQEFSQIDAMVMRSAYASQNHFGRLFDKQINENDVAARLRVEGLEVHSQVPVHVSHCAFEKTYFPDLVVDDMLSELKVGLFRRIQWLNLNHSCLEATTIQRQVS